VRTVSVDSAISVRGICINFFVVYGLPTIAVLIGFPVGRNVWFTPHSGGWLLLFVCLVFSLIAQFVRIARSRTKIAESVNGAVSLALFVILFTVLMELMPNYWPNWS
jgi:hypothetical protein